LPQKLSLLDQVLGGIIGKLNRQSSRLDGQSSRSIKIPTRLLRVRELLWLLVVGLLAVESGEI
jgi:hypothetical protein